MTRECIVVAHWRNDASTLEGNFPMTVDFGNDVNASDFYVRILQNIKELFLESNPEFESSRRPMIDNIIWLPKER